MSFTPGAPAMLASALSFSLMSLMVKLLGERLPVQEIVFFRAIISLALSWYFLRRAKTSVWGKNRRLLLLRGLFGYLGLSCFFYAVTGLPLAEVTVLQYLHPVFTAVLAALILREKAGAVLWISIATSLVGVVLVTRPPWLFDATEGQLPLLPTLAAIAGALLSAAAYTTVRHLSRREHPLVIVFYFPMVAVPASVPAFATNAVLPAGSEWLLILGIGVTAQVGQIMLTRGLRLEPAGRATALSYCQVLFAGVLGWWCFGNKPDLLTCVGAGFVLVGTLLVALPREWFRRTAAESPRG